MSGDAKEETEEKPKPEDKPKNPYGLSDEQQDHFNRTMTREKREGREMGRRALLEELGIEDPNELKKLIQDHKTLSEASKSEVQRLQEENQRLKTEGDQNKQLAAQAMFETRVTAALIVNALPAIGFLGAPAGWVMVRASGANEYV